jgi:hypothetical protein
MNSSSQFRVLAFFNLNLTSLAPIGNYPPHILHTVHPLIAIPFPVFTMRLPTRFPSKLVPTLRAQSRSLATTPHHFQPTALHRAQREADLKAHPESALTQEKLPDQEHNRHWTEENATLSEADVSCYLTSASLCSRWEVVFEAM